MQVADETRMQLAVAPRRRSWSCVAFAAAALAASFVAGCAAEGADAGTLVAVFPPAPVTVHAESYVTEVHPPRPMEPEAPAATLPDAPVVVAPPLDPGCDRDDLACLEAACARGSGHDCEERGDRFRDLRDERALVFYRNALSAYSRACNGGDVDACADIRRISAPGYDAHSYIAASSGCLDGYVMSAGGCIVPTSSSGPAGTTVNVYGNHNVVQVFGSAAKVVGKSAKKARTPGPDSP